MFAINVRYAVNTELVLVADVINTKNILLCERAAPLRTKKPIPSYDNSLLRVVYGVSCSELIQQHFIR